MDIFFKTMKVSGLLSLGCKKTLECILTVDMNAQNEGNVPMSHLMATCEDTPCDIEGMKGHDRIYTCAANGCRKNDVCTSQRGNPESPQKVHTSS